MLITEASSWKGMTSCQHKSYWSTGVASLGSSVSLKLVRLLCLSAGWCTLIICWFLAAYSINASPCRPQVLQEKVIPAPLWTCWTSWCCSLLNAFSLVVLVVKPSSGYGSLFFLEQFYNDFLQLPFYMRGICHQKALPRDRVGGGGVKYSTCSEFQHLHGIQVKSRNSLPWLLWRNYDKSC